MSDDNFFLIIPEATTNLITRPSGYATTSWNSDLTGETFTAQSPDYALFGTYSLKLATGASGTKNFYYDGVTLDNNTQYSLSCYIRESTGAVVSITHGFVDSAAGNVAASSRYLGNGWYLFYITTTTGTVTNNRCGFVGIDYSKTYYIHMQLEAKDTYTTFCQGGLPGCTWSGNEGESESTRNQYEHTGGRYKSLYTDYGILPEPGSANFGMPPREILTVPSGGIDGSTPSGAILNVKERMITISGTLDADNMTKYHANRRAFIQAMNHRFTPPGQQPRPRILEYRGSDTPRQIEVYWQGGLEFTADSLLFTDEKVVLELKAPKPLWNGVGGSVVLDNEITKDNLLVAGKINGSWSNFTPPASITSEVAAYEAIYFQPTSKFYIVGDFTDLGGVVGDYIVDYSAILDTFSPVTLVPPTSVVRAIITGTNGRIYLADNSNVKYATPLTTSALTNIGTVAGGSVYDMAIDSAGDLYVVGSFTGINGVANTSKIAKYDISAGTWGSVSTTAGAPNATLTHIHITNDDLIHVAGDGLTLINAVSCPGIGRKSVTDTTWYNGSAGFALNPVAMDYMDGYLYVADSTDLRIYRYLVPSMASTGNTGNYTQYPGILSAYTGTIRRLRAIGNTLYICGSTNLTFIGLASGSANNIAAWNGTNLFRPFADFYPNVDVYDLCFDGAGNVIFCLATGTSYYAAGDGTVNYYGSADAYPTITITHTSADNAPRTIKYIGNETLGLSIPLNYSLRPGETLTLYFQPEKVTAFSSVTGEVKGIFSELSNMEISAGLDSTTYRANNFSLLVLDAGATASVSASIQWVDQYWSFD